MYVFLQKLEKSIDDRKQTWPVTKKFEGFLKIFEVVKKFATVKRSYGTSKKIYCTIHSYLYLWEKEPMQCENNFKTKEDLRISDLSAEVYQF